MVIGTQQKNRRHLPRCLLQKIIHSDFLRRHYPHQVKGSKFRYFLSACFTSSPVFDCDCILHPLRTNCKRGQRRAQRCKTFFTQVLGRFTQVLLKKKVKYGIFKADAYPPPVSKKEEFHMKQTTLTQRLLSALVALCMVLSVCAPALAAGRKPIWFQKSDGLPTPVTSENIGKLLPGYSIAYNGNTVTITMGSGQHTQELEGVTLLGGRQDLVLCTAGTSWMTDISSSSNIGLTITGMKNVTVTPARGSNIGFLGSLKIVDCTGDVNLQNSSYAAVVGRLEVDNSKGSGSVTITENCDRADWGTNLPYGMIITSNGPVKIENKNGCAVCGSLEIKESASVDIKGTATNGQAAITGIATISSNGPVKIENQLSKDLKGGAAVGYLNDPNITGTIFEVKKSASVEVISVGANPTLGGWAFIKSSGDVSITNSLGGSAVGRGLIVTTGGAVTVKGDNAAAIKGKATITAGKNVSIQNGSGIAVEGNLTVNSSTGVTVVGNTKKNAVRDEANITSSGAVNISNSQGIAVGKKLTVNNASGTDDVTVSGKGGNTVGGGAKITSRGAVNITNTDNTGLAVSGDLTVHDSSSVKVSGGTDSSPTVSGNITLTSSGKMELSNPNGQVTNKKLTVKNSTGEVSVTGNKSDGSALVQGGASIGTTGTVTITNSSGPAIFSGLNVEQSGGITVTGSRASAPIITGNSTIKNTNKVEIINKDTSGRTAQNITYTPPAGKGYFYQTTQNGRKLHTRNAISSTTPYLCIEPENLYTLTLSEDVTATTGGTKDTKFYAGESVTVTAPADTETTKFEKWTFSGTEPTGLPNGWETSKEFTFKMPASNVTLGASYHTITKYEVKVTGGTIVDKNEPGKTTGSYLPGTEVKVAFTGSTGIEDQFEKWTLSGTKPTDLPNDWQSKPSFSFTMPEGDVTLKAGYKTVYNVSVADGKGTILVNGVAGSRALAGDKITVTETGSDEHHLFSSWKLTSSTLLVSPEDGWEHKPSFTFTMPAGDVSLKADYKQLYDLTVTGGTIVDENGDPGKPKGIYLPGTEVTIQFTDSDDITKQFKQWTLSGTEPTDLPNDWQSKPSFSFTMPEGDVTLTAVHQKTYFLSEYAGKAEFFVDGKQVNQAPAGARVTVKLVDGFINDHREFDQWRPAGGAALVDPEEGWEHKPSFSFTMPEGSVILQAYTAFLYDVNVTHGTIVDESSDTGKPSGIYLPGTEVTIQFTDSDDITKQFKQWTYTGTAPEEPDGGWQTSKTFTFKMPAGDVSLRAEYRETYRIFETAGMAEFFVDGKQVNQAPAGVRVTVKLVDGFNNDHREFDQWQPGVGTALVDPEEGWKHKPSFSFTMPEGDVELQAHTTSLYDVNVTHGTIVDENGDTGTSQKIVKPGELVTVRAESTEENPFLRWTYTGKEPVEPDDGWQTSPEFTFKMPEGNVTLEAQQDQLYKVSINDSLGSVTINGEPRSSLWVKEGETVTVATTLKDGYWMEFEKWNSTGTAPEEPEGGWTETNKSTSTTFTFKMPNGPVELTASWKGDAVVKPDPDEPLDEDFGVEPAPMDTTGGTIAAVAVGGAAIWGGYEIATRVILHSLLPEGAAIPANRGQLALLVWNTAGRPEPAGAPAFADVTDPDMAKAAQWCTEQGTMATKGDRFEPEGWTPKFKVIEVWNKAFPAA